MTAWPVVPRIRTPYSVFTRNVKRDEERDAPDDQVAPAVALVESPERTDGLPGAGAVAVPAAAGSCSLPFKRFRHAVFVMDLEARDRRRVGL
jgi:hypothetical protein